MPDFTSALYLGFKHPSHKIPAFEQLTLGKPSQVEEPQLAQKLGNQIAFMQGLDAGMLGRSTLHLFHDLFGILGKNKPIIFYDKSLYEIPKWAIQQTVCKGNMAIEFPHFSTKFLHQNISKYLKGKQKPIIVTDGFCPKCGKAAPIKKYLEILHPFKGLLVIDDTQAIGLLGKNPKPTMPYGFGGGGILPFLNAKGKHIISVSSMAKSFGVPIAVLAGKKSFVNLLKTQSQSRLHCSPPTFVELNCLLRSLIINNLYGNKVRRQLFQKVRFFHSNLTKMGFKLNKSYFPIQMINCISNTQSIAIYNQLKKQNIQSLLLKSNVKNQAAPAFIITNSHSKNDLKKCLQQLHKVILNRRKSTLLY